MKCDVYQISKEDVDLHKEAYGADNTENLCSALIELARARARLYVMPCNWECSLNDDGSAIVRRYRNV